MSLLRKLEKRDYLGGIFSNPFGAPTYQIPTNGQLAYTQGATPMMSEQAMRHWAVWACVRIVGDVISTLPIDALTGTPPAPIEPTPPRLLIPSAYATAMQWRWQVMISLLLRGNAYGLVSARDRLEYPTQVDLIAPQAVRVEKDKAGHKVFKVGSETLSAEQVWHLPGPQLPGELEGMSPIKYAARTIGLGLEAEKFGYDFLVNGMTPTAVLESDQLINDDQAKDIKGRVKNAAANRDMAVLGAGLKLNKWTITAEESQFLETHRYNAVSIAAIYGVPAEMLGASSASSTTVTYANREQKAQDFLNQAVNPWLARLEESLSAWFPRGTFVKFNTGALLRSDLLTRYQSYELGIHNNFLLPSEARGLENLPAIDGIDDKPLMPKTTPTSTSTQGPTK